MDRVRCGFCQITLAYCFVFWRASLAYITLLISAAAVNSVITGRSNEKGHLILSQKRSVMARVVKESHSFTFHPRESYEWNELCLSGPRRDGRLSQPRYHNGNNILRTATWRLSQLLAVHTVMPHWASRRTQLAYSCYPKPSVEPMTSWVASHDANHCATESQSSFHHHQNAVVWESVNHPSCPQSELALHHAS